VLLVRCIKTPIGVERIKSNIIMNYLLISLKDITQLTTLSGNIDQDMMNPSINLAQNTDLKRILGTSLYNKIINDKKDGTLSGVYKTIYDDHVVMMLVFLACARYTAYGGYKTANQGIFKTSAEGHTSVDYKEVSTLIARYDGDAATMEREFYKFMSDNPVPEYNSGTGGSTRSNRLIPWY
jgi:hypothetical protein